MIDLLGVTVLLLCVVAMLVAITVWLVYRLKQTEKNMELVLLTLSLASPAIARRLVERGTQVVVNAGDFWEEDLEYIERDE